MARFPSFAVFGFGGDLMLATRRILFIVPYMPNVIRTRPYNLIRALAGEGHAITVLTLVQDDAEVADAEALRAEGIRVITRPLSRAHSLMNSAMAPARREPLQAAYCWQSSLAADLSALLRDETFDVVHVEHLRGSRYGILARSTLAAAGRTTPVVWDSVDCISHLFRQASAYGTRWLNRMIARVELPGTERFEGRILKHFDMVLTTSPVDRMELIRLARQQNSAAPSVNVLPNGVDLDTFKPDLAVERDPATLVLSGKMSYHANVAMAVHLAQEIMPIVWAERPDTRLQIVGKAPTADVRSLAKDPRIIVTGEVPQIQPYLSRATIAVAPIVYSAGIQNKILEAMACATPVVTTSSAMQGLAAEPGRHLLVGEDKHQVAEAIIGLINDPVRREEMGQAGRYFVEENHNWCSIAGQLSRHYEDLMTYRSEFVAV